MNSSGILVKRLYLSFGAIVVLLVCLEVYSNWNFRHLEEASELSIHTYKVLLETEGLAASLAAMSAGARGFLATADDSFLQQYRSSRQNFNHHYNRVRQLTRIPEIQQRYLPDLRRAETKWQAVIEKLMSRRRTDSFDQSLAIANARIEERLRLTEDMNRAIRAIETTENELLVQRSRQHEHLERWMRLIINLSSIFSLLLCAWFVTLVANSNRRLEMINAQLDSANRRLAEEVAERRSAEDKLKQAVHELEGSNADLEQFAYVASHDLQEPLRAVAGCVQVLQRRYTGKLDARADEFIQHAVEGSQRMQMLIHNLLAFSRIGTHGSPFTPIDMETVLKTTLGDMRVSIAESGAQISSDELPVVVGDAQQLQQLLQNLISNAIKFRGPGAPRIHISCRRLDADNVLPEPAPKQHTVPRDGHLDQFWIFSVRDEGIGIESQYFERIFVMFQRLHTRNHYPGTGIGLALCKKIVERHGGRIWVASQPGQGSTFSFSLPMKNTAAVAPSIAEIGSDKGNEEPVKSDLKDRPGPEQLSYRADNPNQNSDIASK